MVRSKLVGPVSSVLSTVKDADVSTDFCVWLVSQEYELFMTSNEYRFIDVLLEMQNIHKNINYVSSRNEVSKLQ